MPRLFIGNFDFEHHLSRARSGGDPWEARLQDELRFVWLAVANDGDAIPAPRSLESGFLDESVESGLSQIVRGSPPSFRGPGWELCPWGWTAELATWGERQGLTVNSPLPDSVRVANSRWISFILESKWGVGLPGATACASMNDVAAAIRDCRSDQRWVFKSEFGMAGRERIRGRGSEMTAAQERMMSVRMETDRVFFEPWAERIDEAGLQFTLPRTGPVRLEAVTPLLCDAHGQYAGSRFDPDPRIESDYAVAIDVGLRAARRLRQLGYYGPLGIDAMRYRSPDGDVRVRPLQDINARWTMGRLSLGLRRLLRPGEIGVWRHVRWGLDGEPREWMMRFAAGMPPGTRIVRTSPFAIDGRPTRYGTFAVLAPAGALDHAFAVTGR